MRRLLLILLLSSPALAAVETTTISGSVVTPNGSAVSNGTVTCTLSQPGRAPDGASNVAVSRIYTATISGGTVNFTLVPNDVITPANTRYECAWTITAPVREKFYWTGCSVGSSPDPLSIGAMQCDVAVNPPPAVPGAAGVVPYSNGAGALAASDISWDATLSLKRNGVKMYAVADAWAHAALYGDPVYYLRPAMWDQWGEVFLGRAQQSIALDENSSVFLSACFDTDSDGTFNDNCSTGNSSNLCALDADGTPHAGGVNADLDGTLEMVVGDLIYIGGATEGSSTPTYFRTYVVQATAVGTGTGDCPNTTTKVTIKGYLPLATAPITPNTTRISRLYLNAKHPTQNGQYLAGAKFASAQRALFGQQGPNVLRNAELTGPRGDAVDPPGWDFDATASVDVTPWPSTSPAGGTSWACISGQTATGDCWRHTSASSATYFQTEDWITVTPGEHYVVSAYVNPQLADPGDYFSLLGDLGDDGTVEELTGTAKCSISQTDFIVPVAAASRGMSWWYCILTVPPQANRVKLRYTKNAALANYPEIDQIEFRRYTGITPDTDGDGTNDSSVEPGQYLLADPGSQTIVFTGDSLAEPFATASEKFGDMFLDGVNAVTASRWGVSKRSQMIATGYPGDKIADTISNFQTRVAQYNPLYCIYSIGVNDVSPGTTTVQQWEASLRTLVSKTMAIGCIPIFVGIPPASTDLASTYRSKIYSFHDAQLRVLRNWAP